MGIFTDSYPGDREQQKDAQIATLKDEVGDEWARAEQAMFERDEARRDANISSDNCNTAEMAANTLQVELVQEREDARLYNVARKEALAERDDLMGQRDGWYRTIHRLEAELADTKKISDKWRDLYWEEFEELAALKAQLREGRSHCRCSYPDYGHFDTARGG